MVHRRVHNADAVIVAQVVIEVALIHAAELEQVVALDHGQVVAEHFVLAVPEALPRVLLGCVLQAFTFLRRTGASKIVEVEKTC